MLQPYLHSVETEGELSAIFLDGRLTHVVRKIPVAGDFRVQDDFGASDEVAHLNANERSLAIRIWELAQTRFTGRLLYGRIDFLRDASGSLVLNEVELVEPSLFFRHAPEAGLVLAKGVLKRLESKGTSRQ
jgi:glutathione synthase/RimK-type ligase-like ATP-grasp enzyme